MVGGTRYYQHMLVWHGEARRMRSSFIATLICAEFHSSKSITATPEDRDHLGASE